ncbi:hypothetical protein [Streptomyces glaucescens]|uniref:hypothetical protein n=1 Tax=Streptomyces glaucescens TaxID=1907 RepID=UPI000A3C18AC|nr:hypothetical protein [Streptomyces glaucescens]
MASELTYKQLQTKITRMQKRIATNAEQIERAAKVIEEEAKEARRECDQMGAKSVDKDTLADSQELSKVLRGLSDGIITYAAKGKDTARQATAVSDQARATHGGFQEAFDRSGVDGLANVSRDWFEQA